MRLLIHTIGLFVGITLFFCITIAGKPIFAHLYNGISPATTATQAGIENLASMGFGHVSAYTRQLFGNSSPRKTAARAMQAVSDSDPLEDIAAHEKDELDELIKTH